MPPRLGLSDMLGRPECGRVGDSAVGHSAAEDFCMKELLRTVRIDQVRVRLEAEAAIKG
jgi:hypothetical protein